MTDLFTTQPESTLSNRMSQQWTNDLLSIARDGRVAPWIELDQLVTKDELNFMRLIEDQAGYTVPPTQHLVDYGTDSSGLLPVSVTRRVDHLTYTLGFVSPGNCQAMINRCVLKGYVLRGECAITGRVRYELSEIGRYMMDLKAREDWFEEDRV